MKPIYWILIIVGVVGAAIATTVIIIKRKKSEENSAEAEANQRRSLAGLSAIGGSSASGLTPAQLTLPAGGGGPNYAWDWGDWDCDGQIISTTPDPNNDPKSYCEGTLRGPKAKA